MAWIMIGPGAFHLVEIETPPQSGDELNLHSGFVPDAVYRVTRQGDEKWCDTRYPYYTFERVRDLPPGAQKLRMKVLNR